MASDDIADSFAFHRATPDVAVDEHVRRRLIELGEWVMARERVYLDKCVWIHLRGVRANSASPPGASALLASLAAGVAAGKVICPVSDVLFLELMKQTDPATRSATAELIDELSLGVALSPEPTRVATEVAHFFHASIGHDTYPLEHLVWTKVPYILGVPHPVARTSRPDEQTVIQKALFDYLWDLTLSAMVSTIGNSSPFESRFAELSSRLNRDNAANAQSMKSFARVYRDEINGALELAAPIAADVLHDMARKAGGGRRAFS